jgi:hypothetical protein
LWQAIVCFILGRQKTLGGVGALSVLAVQPRMA